jgi:hypothetical protein
MCQIEPGGTKENRGQGGTRREHRDLPAALAQLPRFVLLRERRVNRGAKRQ